MGFEKIRRPLLTSGVQVPASGGSAPDPNGLVGDLRAGGTFVLPTESVTLVAADQTLSADGVSFVTMATSGAGREAIIPNPPFAGAVKYIFVINNTTSSDTRLHTASTANVFWGTTFNTVAISTGSTGSPGGTPGGTPSLCLVGASTTQWAIMPGTTFNWDFSASTGSTGIA